MSGYTDSAFRQIVKEICPRVVCFTEFTSVDGILHGNDATMRQIFFKPEKERPIVVQIFGKKPEKFKSAVKLLAELGADAIDINMGCPAKKIISADYGSALLKNPNLAQEIVRSAVESTSLPVSVKMRIGISAYDPDYFFKLALSIERAGASLLTIHGRLSKQMYSGSADWKPLYELKKILKIPLIGNGDIKNGKDAIEKINGNDGNALDGVMVGRGALGNPWIFQELENAFENKPWVVPSFKDKLEIIKRHINLECELKGERTGILEMRKQLAWYIRSVPGASKLRQKLVKAVSAEEVFAILRDGDGILD